MKNLKMRWSVIKKVSTDTFILYNLCQSPDGLHCMVLNYLIPTHDITGEDADEPPSKRKRLQNVIDLTQGRNGTKSAKLCIFYI